MPVVVALVRPSSVVKFGKVVVAESLSDKSVVRPVKIRSLLATLVVSSPSDEVAIVEAVPE